MHLLKPVPLVTSLVQVCQPDANERVYRGCVACLRVHGGVVRLLPGSDNTHEEEQDTILRGGPV